VAGENKTAERGTGRVRPRPIRLKNCGLRYRGTVISNATESVTLPERREGKVARGPEFQGKGLGPSVRKRRNESVGRRQRWGLGGGFRQGTRLPPGRKKKEKDPPEAGLANFQRIGRETKALTGLEACRGCRGS